MKNVSQNQESRKDFEAAKISDNKVCSTSINFDHFRFFSPISKRISILIVSDVFGFNTAT